MSNSFESRRQYFFPRVLIIGVQKAGTTTLFDLLNKVPGLCGSDIKETGFFSKKQLYEQGEDWYSQRFAHCVPDSICFEATPAYIFHPDSPSRISSFNPNMKLIVIFREPAARCYSAWNMFRRFNENNADDIYQQFTRFADVRQKEAISDLLFTKDFPSFRQAVKDDIERYNTKCDDIEPSFVRRGIYHEQITRYLNYFDLSSFLFLEQNELNDLQLLSLRLSDFLGVDIGHSILAGSIKSNVAEYKIQNEADNSVLQGLREFYIPHNERLFGIIGRRFSW
jgi:hypothetical protein